MRELRKNPVFRARENELKRRWRKQKKAQEKKNEEETVLRLIANQYILSYYVYKVEEMTGKDTEHYAIRLKGITEVTTYDHVRISEAHKESKPTFYYIGLPMVR